MKNLTPEQESILDVWILDKIENSISLPKANESQGMLFLELQLDDDYHLEVGGRIAEKHGEYAKQRYHLEIGNLAQDFSQLYGYILSKNVAMYLTSLILDSKSYDLIMCIVHRTLEMSEVGIDEICNFDNVLKGTIFAHTVFSMEMYDELEEILNKAI